MTATAEQASAYLLEQTTTHRVRLLAGLQARWICDRVAEDVADGLAERGDR
jgi:hypothetical protein